MENFIIFTLILKWLTVILYIMGFSIWSNENIANIFLKYSFLILGIFTMIGSTLSELTITDNLYHKYIIITNIIIFGIMGIIWRQSNNLNLFIKFILIIVSFLTFYTYIQ
jgi:hypothetical protein